MGRRKSGVEVLKRMMRTMGLPSDGGEDILQRLTWCQNRSQDLWPVVGLCRSPSVVGKRSVGEKVEKLSGIGPALSKILWMLLRVRVLDAI